MTRARRAAGFRFPAGAALSGCTSEALSDPSAEGTGEPGPTAEAPTTDDYVLTEYPPGPYGRSVGSVIENLEFLGWHDPVAANYDPANFEIVRLSDFYDPSGEQLKLIVLNASAVWCSVCRAEYRHFENMD